MADTPEDVYREAAHAMVGAQGFKVSDRTRRELAAGWWRRDDFRHAIDVAFGAGRESWSRDHPLPICTDGEVVVVTDLKAWLQSKGTDGSFA